MSKLIFGRFLPLFAIIVVSSILFSPKAHATSITVGGACTLDDAVASINAGSDQSGCVGSGAYGSGDFIGIPAGTHSYSAVASITDKEIVIQGAGMGQTIIDCGGANAGLVLDNTTGSPLSASISGLSIIDMNNIGSGISLTNYSADIFGVEVYGVVSGSASSAVSVHHHINGLSSSIDSVYVHDMSFSTSIISIDVTDGSTTTGNIIDGVTIDNASITGNAFAIALLAVDNGGTITGTVQDSTVSAVNFANPGGYIVAYSDGTLGNGTRNTNLTAINNTIVANRAITNASVLGLLGIALASPGRTANTTLVAQNNLIVGAYQGTDELMGCGNVEYGVGGTESATFTSTGGNITDDSTSCSSYFNQSNDQVSVANLGATLGPLQNNGGTVPTIALLAGSPAIDNGITNSLAYDQRGVDRPQGVAFDSGAYEYQFPPNNNSNNTSGNNSSNGGGTLAQTGQSVIFIILTVSGLMLASILVFFLRRYRT